MDREMGRCVEGCCSRDGLRLGSVEAVGHSERLSDECFEAVSTIDRGGWESGGFEAICEGLHEFDRVIRVRPTDEAVREVIVTDSVQCNCGGHCAVPPQYVDSFVLVAVPRVA